MLRSTLMLIVMTIGFGAAFITFVPLGQTAAGYASVISHITALLVFNLLSIHKPRPFKVFYNEPLFHSKRSHQGPVAECAFGNRSNKN